MSTEKKILILDQFIDINSYVWRKLKKNKKLLSNKKREITYDENIFDTAYKIDARYHNILEVVLNNPNSNITIIAEKYRGPGLKYNIHSSLRDKDNHYKKITRMVKDMEEIQLIEVNNLSKKQIGNFDKTTIPYRLTIHGIFFVILNNEFIGFYNVIKSLIKNYPSNILFQAFLYPYIEKKSLEDLGNILSHLVLFYLEDVIKLITGKIQIWSMPSSRLIDGYFPETLFSWPINIDARKNIFIKNLNWSQPLRKYLNKEFGWDWIYTVSIIARPEMNLITIESNNSNQNISIRINIEDKTAVILIDKKKFEIFKVNEEDDQLLIQGKGRHFKKLIEGDLKYGVNLSLLQLLFAIGSIDTQEFPNVKQVLSKDTNFKRTTNDLINVLKIE